jgi:hypothetical protein
LWNSLQFWSPLINSSLYCIQSVSQQPHLNICRLIHASRVWMARCIDIVRCLGDGSDGTSGAIKIDEHQRRYLSIASEQ